MKKKERLKRGNYANYDPSLRAEIAKFSLTHTNQVVNAVFVGKALVDGLSTTTLLHKYIKGSKLHVELFLWPLHSV